MVEVHVGGDMNYYGGTAMERTMKVQEVILRAMAKKLTWWQAAEILGISDRQMRRWKRRYGACGYGRGWRNHAAVWHVCERGIGRAFGKWRMA